MLAQIVKLVSEASAVARRCSAADKYPVISFLRSSWRDTRVPWLALFAPSLDWHHGLVRMQWSPDIACPLRTRPRAPMIHHGSPWPRGAAGALVRNAEALETLAKVDTLSSTRPAHSRKASRG